MVPGVRQTCLRAALCCGHRRDGSGTSGTPDFTVLLPHTLSWAIRTVTVWNSLSLGPGGQREIQVPSMGSGELLAETEKEPKQPRTESSRVSRSGYFWHRPLSWGAQTSGHGKASLGPPGSPSHLVALRGGSCRRFPSLDDLLSAPNKHNNLRRVLPDKSHTDVLSGGIRWGRHCWVSAQQCTNPMGGHLRHMSLHVH